MDLLNKGGYPLRHRRGISHRVRNGITKRSGQSHLHRPRMENIRLGRRDVTDENVIKENRAGHRPSDADGGECWQACGAANCGGRLEAAHLGGLISKEQEQRFRQGARSKHTAPLAPCIYDTSCKRAFYIEMYAPPFEVFLHRLENWNVTTAYRAHFPSASCKNEGSMIQ